ncbi:NAD(P)H oxidoreductase [Roseovarius indicus]|jgi:NAD(P)H dehydrogenase (quinone)|uniref:NAD(P)H oxidoreductase n=1 Tax=Roseovarius indicus TaxID=540747 RepID=UPI0007D92CC1|nr:NAD(P)H oxidoreductase [Roseovarius indicus]OAN98221.1 hypothetical protein A8B76_19735 [Roseovarius indicus]
MKVLIVLDHPRRDSLTGAVADKLAEGLKAGGHVPEIADLHREGFDPRMKVEDEPIWGDKTQTFSEELLEQQARVDRNDAIAFVFPVWWWGFPAMTRGWIERVWNQGWAHGWGRMNQSKGLILGVAADNAPSFAKRNYEPSMKTLMLTGIVHYCGIEEGRFELLYDSLTSPEHQKILLDRAFELGETFETSVTEKQAYNPLKS